MPTFDTPEPIHAAIEIASGYVRVKASDRTDTLVEITPSDESDAADVKAADQTRVAYTHGRLSVKAPKHQARWWSFGWGPSVVVTVELPTGSNIDVDASAADVRCEGRFEEAKLDTSYGDIWLDQAVRQRLHSGYGDITAIRSIEHADVTTSGGQVRIDEIDGTAVVKNAHGNITVGEIATGEARLNTSSGEIKIDRALGDVTAKTAYGSVRIGSVVRGSIVAETAYGRLHIGIAEGTAAWLDVSSQHGRVDSSLDAAEGPAESEETAEVRAHTGYGEIVIRRA